MDWVDKKYTLPSLFCNFPCDYYTNRNPRDSFWHVVCASFALLFLFKATSPWWFADECTMIKVHTYFQRNMNKNKAHMLDFKNWAGRICQECTCLCGWVWFICVFMWVESIALVAVRCMFAFSSSIFCWSIFAEVALLFSFAMFLSCFCLPCCRPPQFARDH